MSSVTSRTMIVLLLCINESCCCCWEKEGRSVRTADTDMSRVVAVCLCSYLQSKPAALTSFTARGSAGGYKEKKEMQSVKEGEQLEAFLYSEASWHVLPVAALNIYAMLSLVYGIHHVWLRDQRVCQCSFVKRSVFVAAVIQIRSKNIHLILNKDNHLN